jgi:hypothetical protein
VHCGLRTSGGLFSGHSWCLLYVFIRTRQISGDLYSLLVLLTCPSAVIRSHLVDVFPITLYHFPWFSAKKANVSELFLGRHTSFDFWNLTTTLIYWYLLAVLHSFPYIIFSFKCLSGFPAKANCFYSLQWLESRSWVLCIDMTQCVHQLFRITSHFGLI